MKMARVNRLQPCPICQKATWCLIGSDGVLCMRVESPKPRTLSDGSVGWMHPANGNHVPPSCKLRPPPIINVSRIVRDWSRCGTARDFVSFSESLGVTRESLTSMECLKYPNGNAFAFPMVDGHGNYIGLRIRHGDGRKWAEPGSHSGIFVPLRKPGNTVLICEGPTDCAAALDFGYYAIGRPSCSGGVPHLKTIVKRLNIDRVIIVADNDTPGIRGAESLRAFIGCPSCILLLPTKDLRDFKRCGGTREMLDAMVGQLLWNVG